MKSMLLSLTVAACALGAVATPSLALETQPGPVKHHRHHAARTHYHVVVRPTDQPIYAPSTQVLDYRQRGEAAQRYQEQNGANASGGMNGGR